MLYSKNMKLNKPLQKAKVEIRTESLKLKEISDFTGSEFQKLKQRKLAIPVKLFHL